MFSIVKHHVDVTFIVVFLRDCRRQSWAVTNRVLTALMAQQGKQLTIHAFACHDVDGKQIDDKASIHSPCMYMKSATHIGTEHRYCWIHTQISNLGSCPGCKAHPWSALSL